MNYNERKVKAGKAKLIMAQLYPKECRFLNFDDKLFRLTDLAARNVRTKTNTVHLSLNFDLTENLPEERLCQIAEAYMEKIGFGQQPFLTYQHFDAGHNHIHILTTNIDADGTRISLHNIGKLKSEPARKAIEQEYGLVKAEDQDKSITNQKNIKPLIYGGTDTKRAISNIVNHVSHAYKFTSLAEFNAVLAGYNVLADRGPKETVMFEHGGLRYWALDGQGNKTGVPQKASSLYKKPTLKLLGERFKLNEYLRKPFKNSLSSIIDKAIPQVRSHQELKALLQNKAIDLLIRRNPEGRNYGLTFIDQNNKVVFNGSDLGKAYSAAAIEARYGQEHLIQVGKGKTSVEQHASTHEILNASETQQTTIDLLGDLLSPTEGVNNQSLFDRQKKKKRRRLKL
ncbi:MAG: relaxase/mobilization nuclease domain-containing protein [Mucilaginibacter sp.]